MIFDYTDRLPDKAVVLNVLHIVEYLNENGGIYKLDLSHGADKSDLSTGKGFELAGYANMISMFPYLAEMIHDHCGYDDDEDDGQEPQPAVI